MFLPCSIKNAVAHMLCNRVAFMKTTGITKMTEMTKTTRTATNKRVECWMPKNHRNPPPRAWPILGRSRMSGRRTSGSSRPSRTTQGMAHFRKVADVWEKDVWEFQAKSGSSGSCRLFLHFLGKIAVRKMSGRTPGSPRHPSSRHLRPSDMWGVAKGSSIASVAKLKGDKRAE